MKEQSIEYVLNCSCPTSLAILTVSITAVLVSLVSRTCRSRLSSSNGSPRSFVTAKIDRTSFANAFCALGVVSWWRICPLFGCMFASNSLINLATSGPATQSTGIVHQANGTTPPPLIRTLYCSCAGPSGIAVNDLLHCEVACLELVDI